jgi:hypothetical protein
MADKKLIITSTETELPHPLSLRQSKRGRDVAKSILALCVVVLACGFAGAQDVGQLSRESHFDPSIPVVGGALTCSPQQQVLRVPAPVVARAKLKARLITLLRESIFDDAKGIVNIPREKEIKKLADKLKHED